MLVQGVAVSDIGIVLFVVVHTVIAGFFSFVERRSYD